MCEGWWQGQALPFLIPQRVTWLSGVLAGRPHRLKGLVPSSFCPHTDLMGLVRSQGIGFVAAGSLGYGEEEPLCPSPWGSTWGSPLWLVTEPGEAQGSSSWSPRWLSLFTVSALGTCFREQCACWEPGHWPASDCPLCSL